MGIDFFSFIITVSLLCTFRRHLCWYNRKQGAGIVWLCLYTMTLYPHLFLLLRHLTCKWFYSNSEKTNSYRSTPDGSHDSTTNRARPHRMLEKKMKKKKRNKFGAVLNLLRWSTVKHILRAKEIHCTSFQNWKPYIKKKCEAMNSTKEKNAPTNLNENINFAG